VTKRIFRAIIICCVITLVVCLATMCVSMYDYVDDTVFQDLQVQARLIAQGVALSGQTYLDAFDHGINRITWIDPEGVVLYDSDVDAASLANHADREEIRLARENGEGKSERISDTMTKKTYYYACALSDGSVIRVASVQPAVTMFMLHMLPAALLLIAAAGAVSIVFARKFTRHIVQPINQIDLENPCASVCYEELAPLLTRIDRQNELARARMDDMQHAQEEAQRQEMYRREFTSNVSHELKTPLTSIFGISEMLMNGMIKKEDIASFAKTIHEESGRLIALVQDILHLSQLDEGQIPQVCESVDLYELAEDTKRRLYAQAKEHDVQIFLHGGHAIINGYRSILEEMIYNLVDNAVKYNKPGGTIDVTAEPFDSGARLIVRDTGIGIAKEHQARVFERFYRVDKGHSRKVGGTGLGLSIVKHAAALHSAAVRMDSTPGKGTTVTVVF
jgi:two-component system phosphate regulon sensor histidine kinase PhoR